MFFWFSLVARTLMALLSLSTFFFLPIGHFSSIKESP
jgi:hypothetical protein